jgi:Tfp pilus assembly protein PilO
MVETKGYTLEEVAIAFDGSSSSLALDTEAAAYQATEDSDNKDRHNDAK